MDEDALGASGAKWRTDTAERPALIVPPERAQPTAPVLPPAPPPGADRSRRAPRPSAPPWIAWVVVAVLLVVAAYVGVRLTLAPPADDVAVDVTPEREKQSANQQPTPSEPADESGADEGGGEEASEQDDENGDEPAPEVAPFTKAPTVQVPGAAPSNNDVTGELVTFAGTNMIDGDPSTCWRVAGDASGRVVTISYPEEVTIARVGLINGYAKTSVDGSGRAFDWYAGNRRITQVEWVVGDQVFSQTLTETTTMQTLDIEPTPTTDIELRITSVSAPGAGPTGRDYTAISDVGFWGYAG